MTVDDGLGGKAQFSIEASGASLCSSGQRRAGGYNLGATGTTLSGNNFKSLVMTGGLTVAPRTLNSDLGIQSVSKVYDGSTSISNLGLNFDRPLAGVLGADTFTLTTQSFFCAHRGSRGAQGAGQIEKVD